MCLDALTRKFVLMCASLLPFKKSGDILYLCCEKIHYMLHSASEMMLWGSLINCSGEAAKSACKINVKGPGPNVNQQDSSLGTLITHARRKETARLMGSAIQGNIIRNNTGGRIIICCSHAIMGLLSYRQGSSAAALYTSLHPREWTCCSCYDNE